MSLLEDFNKCIRNDWITIGNDVQYAVEDSTLYLQCTRSKSDWQHNLDFPMQLYKDSFYVHRGFARLYLSAREELLSLPITRIRAYSQGSAIGLLLHEDVFHNQKKVLDTVLFACPRVLFMPSKKIQNRFHSVKRYRNKEDIVHYLPPFYTHVGQEVVLSTYCSKPSNISFLEWYSGHSPSLYRPRLQELSCF